MEPPVCFSVDGVTQLTCHPSNFITLKQFRSLQQLLLHPLNNSHTAYESAMVAGVATVTQLKFIHFNYWIPSERSSWLQLSYGLIHLTSIELTIPLDILPNFQSLESVVITILSADVESCHMQRFFESSEVMPKLQRISIDGVYGKFSFEWIAGQPREDNYRSQEIGSLPTFGAVAHPPADVALLGRDLTPASLLASNLTAAPINVSEDPVRPVTIEYPRAITTSAAAVDHMRMNEVSIVTPIPMTMIGSEIVPEVDILSPRLVGIELNPGPFNSAQPSQTSAQTIFKDGLLIIYSYLSNSDWLSSIRTCQNWFNVGATESSRHLSFPIERRHEPISKRLLYHITSVHAARSLGSRISVSCKQLIDILQSLPYLTKLSVAITKPEWDIGSKTIVPWPMTLTSFTLSVGNQRLPNLIRSLAQLKNIEYLNISHRTDELYWSGYRSIQQLTRLKDLTLFLGKVQDSTLKLAAWSFLPESLTRLKVSHAENVEIFKGPISLPPLPRLQSLDLPGRNLLKDDLKLIHECAPGLTSLDVRQFLVDDFKDILRFTELLSITFRGPPASYDYGLSQHEAVVAITAVLSDCTRLTHIGFIDWCCDPASFYKLTPRLPALISLTLGPYGTDFIFHVIPLVTRLKRLRTEDVRYDPRRLNSLSWYEHLETFVSIHTDGNWDNINQIKDYLDSPTICPKLKRLVIRCKSTDGGPDQFFIWDERKGISVDRSAPKQSPTYRVHGTAATAPLIESSQPESECVDIHMNYFMSESPPTDEVPAAPLVGIELNPGPPRIQPGPSSTKATTSTSSPAPPLSTLPTNSSHTRTVLQTTVTLSSDSGVRRMVADSSVSVRSASSSVNGGRAKSIVKPCVVASPNSSSNSSRVVSGKSANQTTTRASNQSTTTTITPQVASNAMMGTMTHDVVKPPLPRQSSATTTSSTTTRSSTASVPGLSAARSTVKIAPAGAISPHKVRMNQRMMERAVVWSTTSSTETPKPPIIISQSTEPKDLTQISVESNQPATLFTSVSQPTGRISTVSNDCLFMIVSYLLNRDWINVIQTSHAWLVRVTSLRSRQLSFKFNGRSSNISLPPSYLAPHFTIGDFSTIHSSQMSALLVTFTHLKSATIVASQSSDGQPFFDRSLSWSNLSRLTTLVLRVDHLNLNELLASLRLLAPTLTSLFINVSPGVYAFNSTFGPMLESLTKLTSLTVTSFLDLRSDFITNCRLTHLPESIRKLNLFGGHRRVFDSLHLITPMVNLTDVNLSQLNLVVNDLPKLHRFAPNLHCLRPQTIDASNLAHLILFEHLDTVSLDKFTGDLDVSSLLQSMGRCPRLTHLILPDWVPSLDWDWTQLSSTVPLLRICELTLDYDEANDPATINCVTAGLQSCKNLTSIIIGGVLPTELVNQFKRGLMAVPALPQLTHLRLGQPNKQYLEFNWVTNQYPSCDTNQHDTDHDRTGSVGVLPVGRAFPPQDLTTEGIEPHPGPDSIKGRIPPSPDHASTTITPKSHPSSRVVASGTPKSGSSSRPLKSTRPKQVTAPAYGPNRRTTTISKTKPISAASAPAPVSKSTVMSDQLPHLHLHDALSSAQTLFVDGILSIFGCLSFCDLLPGLHSCHYWYTCGLKERCRQITLKMKLHKMELIQPSFSPLAYRHIERINKLPVYYMAPLTHFTHLTALSVCIDQARAIDTVNHSAYLRKLLPTCRLPISLTSITIYASTQFVVSPGIIQLLVTLLPTAPNLVRLKCTSSFTPISFDLSLLLKLPHLTELTLLQSFVFSLKDQAVCARLSLKRFGEVRAVDFCVFHPRSPFMLNIEDWNWSNWSPGQEGWEHLIQHPPPKLHTLQLRVGLTTGQPIGLSALNLRSLRVNILTVPFIETYLPHLFQCHSTLTHLTLGGFGLSDTHLCQVLQSLTNLESLILPEYATSDSQPEQLTHSLRLLPKNTTIHSVLVQTLDEFTSNLAHSTRLERFDLNNIQIWIFYPTDDESSTPINQLLQMCQSMTQLCEMRLYQINWNKMANFKYCKPITVDMPNTPPNPPLVGIEPNPGPENSSTSLPGAAAAHTSSVTPQQLFKDGLHIIYSFLPLNHWLSCMSTCHSWYLAGRTQPCRGITFYYSQIIHPPPTYLQPHVTRLTQHPNQAIFMRPSVDQIVDLVSRFRNLTQIDQCYLPVDMACDWPITLTHIELFPSTNDTPLLIDSLTKQLRDQLRTLKLFYMSYESKSMPPPELSSLEELSSLTDLTIACPSRADPIAATGIRRLPTTLTSLCLGHGQSLFKSIHTIPPLPNLTYIALSTMALVEGDLKRIAIVAPNLLRLEPGKFYLPDLDDFNLFRSLQTIQFRSRNVNNGTGQLTNELSLNIIGSLSTCPSLTKLVLQSFGFFTATGWSMLARELTQLKELEVQFVRKNDYLTIRTIFTPTTFFHLQRLSLSGKCFDEIKKHFNTREICPQLTSLSLTSTYKPKQYFEYDGVKGVNTDRYRLDQPLPPPIQYTPPPSDLTTEGIESNPGPSTFIRVTPQGLFRDGLHTIFALLTTRDWIASLCTCKNWYAGGSSMPSRQLSCPIGADGSMMDFPSSLAHHFTILLPPYKYQSYLDLTVAELGHMIHEVPSLTSIQFDICGMDRSTARTKSSSSTSPVGELQWPVHLHRLSIGFNKCAYPLFIRTLSSLVELTDLSLTDLTEDMTSNVFHVVQSMRSLRSLHLTFNITYTKRHDLLVDSDVIALPTTLTTISINGGLQPLAGLCTIHLPHLREINLKRHKFVEGELPALVKAFPTLESLAPEQFYVDDFHHILYLKQLHSLVLRDFSPSLTLVQEASLVSTISDCVSLTNLELHSWCLTHDSKNWLLLSPTGGDVSPLTRLKLRCDAKSLLTDHLQGYNYAYLTRVTEQVRPLTYLTTQLVSLDVILIETGLSSSMVAIGELEQLSDLTIQVVDESVFDGVYHYLNSLEVMPQLEQFQLICRHDDYSFDWIRADSDAITLPYRHPDDGMRRSESLCGFILQFSKNREAYAQAQRCLEMKDYSALQCITNLNLSSSGLTTIPIELSLLRGLSSLDVSNNKLECLLYILLPNLLEVDIRGNIFQQMPELMVLNQDSLTTIHFQGKNVIYDLPRALQGKIRTRPFGSQWIEQKSNLNRKHQHPPMSAPITLTPSPAPDILPPKDLTNEGIEPNPGPFVNGISSVTPQTIFKDALHIIYSYLNQTDWLSCLLVSHHWSNCGVTPRLLVITLTKEGTVREIPSKRYLHHPVCLRSRGRRRAGVSPWLTSYLGNLLPTLHELTMYFILPNDVDDQDVNGGKRYPTPSWPIHLTKLDIYLPQTRFPHFIEPLTRATNSLTTLACWEISREADFTIFTHIQDLHVLERLVLTLDVKIEGWSQTVPQPINVLEATRIKQLSPTLTDLNICYGTTPELSLNLLAQMSLPRLTYIDLTRRELLHNDINWLSECAPNLLRLCVELFHPDACSQFHLFKSLQVIQFHHRWYELSSEEYESIMIPSLCACVSLTTIQFGNWRPTHVNSWTLLATSLPKLSKLQLDWFDPLGQPLALDLLLQFSHLTDLAFDDTNSLVIQEYFLSPKVLPTLRRLNVGQSLYWDLDARVGTETYPKVLPTLRRLNVGQSLYWDLDARVGTETYRVNEAPTDSKERSSPEMDLNHQDCEPNSTSTVAAVQSVPIPKVVPPAPILVGIELNPGPQSDPNECSPSLATPHSTNRDDSPSQTTATNSNHGSKKHCRSKPNQISCDSDPDEEEHQMENDSSATSMKQPSKEKRQMQQKSPTWMNHSAVTKFTPQMIFNDALHIIYSYLNLFDWGSSMYTVNDSYRLMQESNEINVSVPYSEPPKDLTKEGIEANPGPVGSKSAAAKVTPIQPRMMTMQNLFVDGLHCVFSFLVPKELAYYLRTCRHWRGAAQSFQSSQRRSKPTIYQPVINVDGVLHYLVREIDPELRLSETDIPFARHNIREGLIILHSIHVNGQLRHSATPEAIVSLMWGLHYLAFSKGQHFDFGTYIIQDQHSRLYDYLTSNRQHYQRRSTHIQHVTKMNSSPHLGFDTLGTHIPGEIHWKPSHNRSFFSKQILPILPTRKTTILFISMKANPHLLLETTQLLIKPESSGLGTYTGYIQHAHEYLRFVGVLAYPPQEVPHRFRGEQVDQQLFKRFHAVVSQWPETTPNRINLKEIHRLAYGLGIRYMLHWISTHESELTTQLGVQKSIDAFNSLIRHRGYDHLHLRTGGEVIFTEQELRSMLDQRHTPQQP